MGVEATYSAPKIHRGPTYVGWLYRCRVPQTETPLILSTGTRGRRIRNPNDSPGTRIAATPGPRALSSQHVNTRPALPSQSRGGSSLTFYQRSTFELTFMFLGLPLPRLRPNPHLAPFGCPHDTCGSYNYDATFIYTFFPSYDIPCMTSGDGSYRSIASKHWAQNRPRN